MKSWPSSVKKGQSHCMSNLIGFLYAIKKSLIPLESSSLKESEEELKESEVIEDRASTRGQSSASSHGHRIKWFLSSASLETIGEEFERDSRSRLQSSASGAVLEVHKYPNCSSNSMSHLISRSTLVI